MTKLEQVARAIAKQNIIRMYGNRWRPEYMQENVDKVWDSYSDHARAAIEAMREPTEEMQRAGFLELGICEAGTWPHTPKAGSETSTWHAMIDAALNEKA